MNKLSFSKISLAEIKHHVRLQEGEDTAYPWTLTNSLVLGEEEQRQVQVIRSHLLNYQVHLMNEATVWSRAIYPLLLLAERKSVQAWAEVSLCACYKNFIIEGIADGVLGRSVAGRLEAPYLVMVESKRGLEAQNPVPQLYGQLLAAAGVNQEREKEASQEIFGCYTIADSWTFVRAEFSDMEADIPRMLVEISREYAEKQEAEMILKILKNIVSNRLSA